MNSILDAREQRNHLITELLARYEGIIQIRANIPGDDKRIKEAFIICRVFFHILKDKIDFSNYTFIDLSDGPAFLIPFDKSDWPSLKSKLVDIESSHALGRFVDLDLITRKKIFSRSDIYAQPRKCYLCDKDAHICARSQTHDYQSLLDFIKHNVEVYLKKYMYLTLNNVMIRELDLEYKFGLVTISSSGAHPDMDYELMIKAKDAILPHLLDIFELSYQHNLHQDALFKKAREIGLVAEAAMLESTHGVNAYKGLIFILGFLLIGIGHDLNKKDLSFTLYDDIKQYGIYLKDDFNHMDKTFGIKAYHQYRFLGARGEIINGFKTLRTTLEHYHQASINDMTLRKILVSIILEAEDSVLLKRAGSIEAYLNFKRRLQSLNLDDMNQVKAFTDEAIKQNISVGGSADLLVAYLCLNKYIHDFIIK